MTDTAPLPRVSAWAVAYRPLLASGPQPERLFGCPLPSLHARPSGAIDEAAQINGEDARHAARVVLVEIVEVTP